MSSATNIALPAAAIDRRSPIPFYFQLTELLTREIEAGRWAVGDRLPSEPAWPTRARLQLKRRWEFEGRVRRMRPGTYEWNVWPGYGPRRRANYGPQIGKGRTFVIPGAPPAP